jgi:hypothetical protein
VENRAEPFAASVRVRERRSGEGTLFIAAARGPLRAGVNSFDVPVAPGGPVAGTSLEVARRGDGGIEGVVFRGDLTRVLRPLGAEERLVLAVGLSSFPVATERPAAVWGLEPEELPRRPEAYDAVDLIVVEEAARSKVSNTQAEALGDYLRGGGRAVFASFRALGAFERVLFAPSGASPRTLQGLRSTLPESILRAGTEEAPRVVEFPFGLGRAAIVAAEPGEAPEWRRKEAKRLLEDLLTPRGPTGDPSLLTLDAAEGGRPFAAAASRARALALVAALLLTVAVALSARLSRRTAALVAGGTGLALAAASALLWGAPAGAARVVRVRAFTADGRAEIVTEAAVLFAFDGKRELAFETETAPTLPIERGWARISEMPFVLEEREDSWRTCGLRSEPGAPALVGGRSAGGLDAGSDAVRTYCLARGGRVRAPLLPGGRRRIEPLGEAPPVDLRRLIERFAPPGEEVAWAWAEGPPPGTRAPGLDWSPGSGTLILAAVRPGAPRPPR